MKLLLAGVVLIGIAGWLYRRSRFANDEQPVSQAWLVTNEHREWRSGMDGPCISWPIRKAENEQAWRQTTKLRKRA